jgi:hypothetical protein
LNYKVFIIFVTILGYVKHSPICFAAGRNAFKHVSTDAYRLQANLSLAANTINSNRITTSTIAAVNFLTLKRSTAMITINCSQTIAGVAPTLNTCPFEVPKSGKFIFGKRTGAAAKLIATTGDGSVALLATWTALLAETDETKVIASAKVTNIALPSTEVPKTDSGSTNGVQRVRLVVPAVTLTAKMFGVTPAFVKELRELSQFSYGMMNDTDLEVFILDEKNNIYCLKSSTAATGIPIWNLEFSSLSIEEGEDFASYMVKFDLAHGWDENLEKVPTAFNMASIVN